MAKNEITLEEKLRALNKRSDELAVELQKNFSAETYREYNITRHKIQVTEQRLDGIWEPASQIKIAQNVQQHNLKVC